MLRPNVQRMTEKEYIRFTYVSDAKLTTVQVKEQKVPVHLCLFNTDYNRKMKTVPGR